MNRAVSSAQWQARVFMQTPLDTDCGSGRQARAL